MSKQKLRDLDAVEEDYFRKHPEEMDDYIQEIFADYAQDRNAPALLASLRVIAKVKGIGDITKEIGPMVWIWMGEDADADEDAIPELPIYDMDKWTHVVGPYNHLEGSYILMQENLCDLSHLPYLHAETFKFPPEYTAAPIKVEQDGDQVTFYRELEDWNLLRPFFHPKLDFGTQKVIYKSGGKYVTPATNKGYGLLIPHDENGVEQPEVGHYVSHYVTPETESTTHYFWFIARNYELHDSDYSKKQGDMVQAGFEEDLFAIRHLQKIIENDTHPYREIGIKADKPGVIMRKIIKELTKN